MSLTSPSNIVTLQNILDPNEITNNNSSFINNSSSITNKTSLSNSVNMANASSSAPVITRILSRKNIKLGICAMDKKAKSSSMLKITQLLSAYGEIDIIFFGDKTILFEDIYNWPKVDCLIAFYSDKYPLQKVIDYVRLTKPFMINDVNIQSSLLDRRSVYAILRENGIETPPGLVFVNREPNEHIININEYPDYIEVNNVRINKPFVEKPASGEDHNVYIYYPNNGGSRRLFRKVENQSSQLYPDENSVRRDGSYIYEEYMNSAIDIKVYTVGKNFAYAETRKSPTIDGLVERDEDGKEVRNIVRLNQEELEIAVRIVNAFNQNVCGFDILRHNNTSYVIDVNGWSFVKGSMQYYDNCASCIRQLCLNAPNVKRKLTLSDKEIQDIRANVSCAAIVNSIEHCVLRSVVSIFRHGDRTPKQKLKFLSDDPLLVNFYLLSFQEQMPDTIELGPLKVKSNFANNSLLSIVKLMLKDKISDPELQLQLSELEFVLTHSEVGKIQIKPIFIKRDLSSTSHASISSSGIKSPKSESLKSVEVVCKWGGVLTHAGIKQAQQYGQIFRNQLFLTHDPVKRKNFLAGLQAFSSDEERVKQTAKIFCESLLETTVLPVDTLNDKIGDLLDGVSLAKKTMKSVKCRIKNIVTSDNCTSLNDCNQISWSFKRFSLLKNPNKKLVEVYESITELLKQIHDKCDLLDNISYDGNTVIYFHRPIHCVSSKNELPRIYLKDYENDASLPIESIQCQKDALHYMRQRWDKLHFEFYDFKTGEFDTSKISDIYDCLKHEVLHYYNFFTPEIKKLYFDVKTLGDFVIPQEYGIDRDEKLKIGLQIVHPLLLNVVKHLEQGFRCEATSRAFLYFTSESHLHALRNSLVLAGFPANSSTLESVEAMNINYFSHCVFRLYEDILCPIESDERFFVNILFSPGAAGDPFEATYPSEHILPVLLPVPLSGKVPFSIFKKIISEVLPESVKL